MLRFEWRRARASRRVWLALAVGVLVLFCIGATRYAVTGADPVEVFRTGLRWGGLRLMVFVLPFLFATGVVSEEVENRTMVYLTTRPVSRISLGLGKYLVAGCLTGGLMIAFVVLLHLICFATAPTPMVAELGFTAKACAIILVLALSYSAICFAASTVAPGAPGVLSALYLGGFEFAASFAPGAIRVVSANFHAQELMGYEATGLLPDSVPAISPSVSIAVLCIPLVLGLLIGLFGLLGSELEGRRRA
jgi:ABC-2 type transport system permease protein